MGPMFLLTKPARPCFLRTVSMGIGTKTTMPAACAHAQWEWLMGEGVDVMSIR